ncbi:MAG: gamma-tocopherol methyltransferase [Parachlamydiales bacterium]|nr:gamma-tocopherol methyltransferase [Parachlamydiales bacterium]
MESKLFKSDLYGDLAQGWYCKSDHPIDFLRAEHVLRAPWVIENIPPARKILDVGCGAGMLANAMAKAGHRVTGIDISETGLNVARTHDDTRSVRYLHANAYSLPFQSGDFDVVCIMDVLEHVEEPHLVIGEAARALKANGLMFFHTINRTMASYLLMIRGIEWCLSNSARNKHSYIHFIKPDELQEMFKIHKLSMQQIKGMRPLLSKAFWKMLVVKQVPSDFAFCFCKSLSAGYCGIARKLIPGMPAPAF